MSIGGGTSIVSFSKSSPAKAAAADGETIVVRLFAGEDDESVILKIPFIPALPSRDFLLEFYDEEKKENEIILIELITKLRKQEKKREDEEKTYNIE